MLKKIFLFYNFFKDIHYEQSWINELFQLTVFQYTLQHLKFSIDFAQNLSI